jgi:hypothetical protein
MGTSRSDAEEQLERLWAPMCFGHQRGFLRVGRGLASSLGRDVSQSPFIFFVVPFYFLFLFSDFLLPFAFWLKIG